MIGGHRTGNNNIPPAIVLGSGLNGLGVARSLYTAGVPVWLADVDVTRPEMRTRCARPLHLAALQGEGLIHELVTCVAEQFVGQRPVLILTQEHSVRTLANVQDQLSKAFRFILPSSEVIQALIHKATFNTWALEAGLRVPLSQSVRSRDDIDLALTSLPMPVVIKPGAHIPCFETQFHKAYHADNREKAWTLLNEMIAVFPDLIVQEWVPGSDSDIYFCLQQISESGQVEASFIGRKIRAWPPGIGGTASCTPAPNVTELTERTSEFFRRTGVRGLASMEYKRHSVTGEYIAIEPTIGRTDYQEEIATLNGFNLPYAYYLSAMGSGAPPQSKHLPRRHVMWRDRDADLLSLEQREQTVRSWPKHGVIRDALWRWTDPQPWLATRRKNLAQKLMDSPSEVESVKVHEKS